MIKKLISFFTTKHNVESDRNLEKRIEELEKIAHPKCGLDGFDGYQPLLDRLDKIEVVLGTLKKNEYK